MECVVQPTVTEESTTPFPNTPNTRFLYHADQQKATASVKAQVEILQMELRAYQQQTDSRILFLEDTVRKQKETISLLLTAFELVNQQAMIVPLATTEPNNYEKTAAIQKVDQADTRWAEQAVCQTWTTPASENLESPEVTKAQFTNRDQRVLHSSEYQLQDDLFGTQNVQHIETNEEGIVSCHDF